MPAVKVELPGIYRLRDQEPVSFDNGVLRGRGKVVGVAAGGLPVLGVTYMVEVTESNVALPTEEYPYRTIVMPECHIKRNN